MSAPTKTKVYLLEDHDLLAASDNLPSKEGKWSPDRHTEALMDVEGISGKE